MAMMPLPSMEAPSVSTSTTPEGMDQVVTRTRPNRAVAASAPTARLTPDRALRNREPSNDVSEKDCSYRLPKCVMPPPSELVPIETFVMNAVHSKHSESPHPSHAQGYRAILDALKRASDPPMLRMILISLRTAGNGRVLNLLAKESNVHAQLVHWIFRLNAAVRPELPEDEKGEQLCSVFYDGSLLDAHLHLILAMVSARTVNLVPALTAVWKMLSEATDLPEML